MTEVKCRSCNDQKVIMIKAAFIVKVPESVVCLQIVLLLTSELSAKCTCGLINHAVAINGAL